MESEKSIPLALTGEEIQEGVLAKVRECMQTNCHLGMGNAYTAARFEITVKMTLFDYGREVKNNVATAGEIDSGIPAGNEPMVIEGGVTMEAMPPNQFRQETDQPVPVQTVVDGQKKIRHLKYSPRKKKIDSNT